MSDHSMFSDVLLRNCIGQNWKKLSHISRCLDVCRRIDAFGTIFSRLSSPPVVSGLDTTDFRSEYDAYQATDAFSFFLQNFASRRLLAAANLQKVFFAEAFSLQEAFIDFMITSSIGEFVDLG